MIGSFGLESGMIFQINKRHSNEQGSLKVNNIFYSGNKISASLYFV